MSERQTEPRDPVLAVRVDEKLMATLDRVAEQQERSRSWVVRRILREALRDAR